MPGSIGRRSFVRAVSGVAGLSVSGCLGRLDGTARVPMLAAGDSVVRSKRVPRSWFRHAKTTRLARESLGGLLSSQDGIGGIKTVRSDERYGGRYGLELSVELQRPAAETVVPSFVEGVEVNTQPADERGLSACYNDGNFQSIPGGVVVEPGDSEVFGTACCPVSRGGERRLLTAAHLWSGCERAVTEDTPVSQSGHHIGQLDTIHDGLDIALVEVSREGVTLDDAIKVPGVDRVDIAGRVTDWGITVLLTDDQSVEKVGVSSGLTEGTIAATQVEEAWNPCIHFGGHGVEAEYTNVEGDSGGPVFYGDEDGAYLVAPQQMWVTRDGTDCGGNIVGEKGRGTAAYHLSNELSLGFGAR